MAAPSVEVDRYLVYYGTAPGRYTQIKDVGLNLATSMTGLAAETAYYFAVVAEDVRGNQGAFSNEHAEAVAGRVRFRAHNEDYLCWGASKCPPRPGLVQRADGWQLMVPVDFPAGNWTKVEVKFTMGSRLCVVGQNGCTNKCGEDGAQGGYNPCGDPWDRTAEVFLVLDETCIQSGGSCVNGNNLEILHAITPFGTDAPPPAGSGVVPPRGLTMDITPYVPLLQGRKYVGAQIGHYVQAGWRVTTEFLFSKRPEEASPKPPADGIVLVGWGGGVRSPNGEQSDWIADLAEWLAPDDKSGRNTPAPTSVVEQARLQCRSWTSMIRSFVGGDRVRDSVSGSRAV